MIIANANKNLGPVGIGTKHYIKLGLDHLLDSSTYKLLTKDQADQDIHDLGLAIHAWTIAIAACCPMTLFTSSRSTWAKQANAPLGTSISSSSFINYQSQDAPSVLTVAASHMLWAAMWMLHCNQL